MRVNDSGHYEDLFPYLSPCGRENNYIRCDDVPVVFTQMISSNDKNDHSLIYNYSKLEVDFQPEKLYMAPNGRIYHPGPERLGGIGLIKSQMAIAFSQDFSFDSLGNPTHFTWKNNSSCVQIYQLDQSLKSNPVFAKKIIIDV